MATILVTDGVPVEGFSVLSDHELIIPAPQKSFTREEMLRHIARADAVVAFGTVSREYIEAAQQLKIIANYGAGYDRVDIRAAAERGIPVTNIPETVTRDTAELAIGLMLAVSRRIGELNLRMRQEQPESLFGPGLNMGSSLHGRTLGIVGCGRIGSRVAQIAKVLGMRVVGYSRRGADPAVAEPVSLEMLLEMSDVISLHCPLTDETRGLINRAAFARMKPGAMLINTARGPVVELDALLEALDNGTLSGAGLDVFPEEPHVPAELIVRSNVICTPHMGTNTRQTRWEMSHACALQILDVLNGKRPSNIVNGL